MKILNVSINENNPPEIEVLIELCLLVNKQMTIKEIIKQIEKNELYKPIKQSNARKKPNTTTIRNADTI